MNKIKFFLPPRIQISILKNKKINWFIFYNDNFFQKFFLKTSSIIFFNKQLNFLIVKTRSTSIFKQIFLKNFENFIFSWNFYFFSKFKWKGKGFRMYRRSKNKFMKYFFGHSHFKIVKFNRTILLKINKNKFIIYNTSINSVRRISKEINNIKPTNLFTKRGLRSCRKIIDKRRGKSLIF